MPKAQTSTLMEGAIILTISSFLAKLLSAVYRVPFQNLVGDQGFYVYQQIYPIYGMAMILALSSFPQFLSKVTVGQTPLAKKQTMQAYFPLLFWLSFGAWLFLFVMSKWLAIGMGDPLLAPLIRVVAFTFLLVPILALYRGSFQGEFVMIPTAISQVFEQLVRVGIILLAAMGVPLFQFTVYEVGELALTGSIFGGIIAWWILAYYGRKITGASLMFRDFIGWRWPKRVLQIRFFREAGMLTIYAGLLILFQLVDSFFVVNSLKFSGMSTQQAQISKGVYDRGQPFVQLGLVVAGALGTSFLPLLTDYLGLKQERKFQFAAQLYLRLTVTISLAASVGLVLLMPFLNYTLFKDFNGTCALCIFVCSIALMATIQAFQSVDQSRNKVLAAFKAAVGGCFVKLGTTGILTVYFQLIGASLSTLFGLLTVLIIFLYFDEMKVRLFWTNRLFGWRLIGVLCGMILAVLSYDFLWYTILAGQYHRGVTLAISFVGVVLGASVFLIGAVKLKLFTIREWLMIPFGKKLIRLGAKK